MIRSTKKSTQPRYPFMKQTRYDMKPSNLIEIDEFILYFPKQNQWVREMELRRLDKKDQNPEPIRAVGFSDHSINFNLRHPFQIPSFEIRDDLRINYLFLFFFFHSSCWKNP